MERSIVVVGGGVAGLVAALRFSSAESDVILVEQADEFGGLLRTSDYGYAGRFDQGMHNLYETGESDLDQLLFSLLPDEQWEVLEGNRRDLAGNFYRGRLYSGSPYPDFRQLSKVEKQSFIRGLVGPDGEDSISLEVQGDCASFLLRAYGQVVAPAVNRIVEKQFGLKPSQLHASALKYSSLLRVVLLDEDELKPLMGVSSIRDRVAWPDQRTLPAEFSSGRKAFYPKDYGIDKVVGALVSKLGANGVKMLTRSKVTAIKTKGSTVTGVTLQTVGGEIEIPNVESLLWTAPIRPLAELLEPGGTAELPDRPRATLVANLLFDDEPLLDDLYYAYCFEESLSTFRVTNYANYCSSARRNGFWPVSVEMFVDSQAELDGRIIRQVHDEVVSLNVARSAPVFSRVERLGSGFPLPSLQNLAALHEASERVATRGFTNLTVSGVHPGQGIFFQHDVLRDMWRKVKTLGFG